jgi:hypothetical protein
MRTSANGFVSSVRRLVSSDVTRCAAALAEMALESTPGLTGRPSRHRNALAGGRAGWLAIAGSGVGDAESVELHVPSLLHVRHSPLVVPVDLALGAWSSTRSELRLDLLRRNRQRRRLPRHYFDAAHDVMDALRGDLESRTTARE